MKRLKFDQVAMDNNAKYIAYELMLLSRGHGHGHGHVEESTDQRRVFECKTCNRQFPSFQALGGHRASHKKPRLSHENQLDRTQSAVTKPKVHECSICGLEFAIGQALGGHMRRHRAVAGEGFGHGIAMEKETRKSSDEDDDGDEKRVHVVLDLNLPPLDDVMECRKLGVGMVC